MTETTRKLEDVHIGTRDLSEFLTVHDEETITRTMHRAARISELIDGRTVWNINTTAVGGGVAEMLQSMLAFTRGLDIDARWLVLTGSAEFFKFTKRLHHALHGEAGDNSLIGPDQRALYEATMRENAADLCSRVQKGDFVLLHDPQNGGLLSLYQISHAVPVSKFSVANNNSQLTRSFVEQSQQWIEPEIPDYKKSPISDRQIIRRLNHDIALSFPLRHEKNLLGTVVIGIHQDIQVVVG